MSIAKIIIAYAISIIAGGILAKLIVVWLRRKIDPTYTSKKRVPALDWTLGGIERAIATTLVIWAPALVPAFVGGWIALKLASNWQRRSMGTNTEDEIKVGRSSLAALCGNAVSFAVAIVAGVVLANPEALKAWTK